ncbi:MAG: alpha/beta hydrolase [Pseudomonadota bacterium]
MRPIDEWRDAAQFMPFGDFQIAWWSSGDQDGDKPSLLLIHGFPTSAWDWTAIWPQLAERFHLVAVDMLGFGLSDKPSNHRYSIMEQADLQEAILERLGVGETHLLVHDYGNTVAQELIARQQEKSLSFLIKSTTFLNGGLFPEQHRARLSQKLGLTPLGPLLGMMMTKDRFRQAFDEVFGPETKASDGEINGHWKLINEHHGTKILHKLLRYIPERRANRSRWVGAIKETNIPLRLIDGGADPVSGAHLYDYYLEQIPDADAVLFPDIGHYPQTEAPDETLLAFLEFHQRLKTFGR